MDNLLEWVIKTTVATLSVIVISVVVTLLYGFFDSSVNNEKIFEIIGPAFNTVIGAFVGLLGGLSINKSGCKDKSNEKA